MNRRSREILSWLIQKQEVEQDITIHDLAEKFQVSSRTIRNDINDINDYLTSNRLSLLRLGKHGKIETDPDIREATGLDSEQGMYSFKLSREDRLNLAALILICRHNYSTLQGLADDLYISRSTMIQDLDDLKGYFRKHKLYLFTQSNKGLLLEGEERHRRTFLFYLIQHNKSLLKEQVIYSHLISCLTEQKEAFMEDRVMIARIINKAEHQFGRYMTDEGFFDLKTYMEMMSFRIKEGCYIEKADFTKNSKYDMAEYLIQALRQRLIDQKPDPDAMLMEIPFLSDVLNNIRYLRKTTSNRNIVKMQVMTRSFIENVSRDIGVNLQNDYTFFENLSNHLESTFSSTVDNFDITDVVGEILRKYPDVLDATKKHAHIFEEYIHRDLSEGEVSYVAVHVCAALERHNQDYYTNRVLLVCNGGLGTSQILLGRLNQFFHFDHVEVLSSHDLSNEEISDSDLVISAIPLKDFDHDYIQVDPLLSDMDCIRLADHLSQLPSRKDMSDRHMEDGALTALKRIAGILDGEGEAEEMISRIRLELDSYFSKKNQVGITDLLKRDAIRTGLICANWQEAIRLSADYLQEKGYVKQSYVERMIQNIMDNGPYIVLAPGFALPHEALDSGSMKAGMSLIRLKTPVVFGKEEFDPVEWVCCLSAIDKEKHLKAMFSLVNLFHDPTYRMKLQQCDTEWEIYRVIREYELLKKED